MDATSERKPFSERMQDFLSAPATAQSTCEQFLGSLIDFIGTHGERGTGVISGLERLKEALHDLSDTQTHDSGHIIQQTQILRGAAIPLEAARMELERITQESIDAKLDKIELQLGLKNFAVTMDKAFPGMVQVARKWNADAATATDIADKFGAFLASDVLYIDGQKFTPYEAISRLAANVEKFKDLRKELIADAPELKNELPTASALDHLSTQFEALLKNLQQLEVLSQTRKSEDHPTWEIIQRWSKPVDALQKVADQIFDAYIKTHESPAQMSAEGEASPQTLGQLQKSIAAQITEQVKGGFQSLDVLMLGITPAANMQNHAI